MYEWMDSNDNQQMEEEIEMLETLRNMTTAHMFCSERKQQSYDDFDLQVYEQSYKNRYDISNDWLMKDDDSENDEHMQMETEVALDKKYLRSLDIEN